MKKGKQRSFLFTRWTGRGLTLLAAGTFVTSFFLPAAGDAATFPGTPPTLSSGWEVFVESVTAFTNSYFGIFNPILFMCLLAPVPNVLMLVAVPGNLLLRRAAVALGIILALVGGLAFWFCWHFFGYLAIGFYVWIGSIFATAFASFLIAASYVMEENFEYDQRLAALRKTCESLP